MIEAPRVEPHGLMTNVEFPRSSRGVNPAVWPSGLANAPTKLFRPQRNARGGEQRRPNVIASSLAPDTRSKRRKANTSHCEAPVDDQRHFAFEPCPIRKQIPHGRGPGFGGCFT
jgi:hypothetical protein